MIAPLLVATLVAAREVPAISREIKERFLFKGKAMKDKGDRNGAVL